MSGEAEAVDPAAAGGLQHAAMPYAGAGELAAGVARFASLGAKAGGAMLVIVGGTHLGLLQRMLDETERVSWADMSTVRNPARLIGRIRRFADEYPGRGLWCILEPVWHAPSVAELCEVIRHEALVNRALAGIPMTMLCAYDQQLGDDVLASVELAHPELLSDGRRRPSSRYADGLIPEECDQPLSPPPADAQCLPYRDDLVRVRAFTAAFAQRAGLSPTRTGDLVTAVAELAANTLMHTGGPGVLRLWTADGELITQVNDSGNITDPLAGRLPPRPAVAAHGYGLWVVQQVCDLVEIRTGPAGNTIRLHHSLSPEVSGWQPGRR